LRKILEKITIDKHIRAQNVPNMSHCFFIKKYTTISRSFTDIALFAMGGGILFL